MPKHHKPITDHVPMDYSRELSCIERYLDRRSERFLVAVERWDLRPLEFDDLEALIEQVKRRLIRFALDCNALPRRTPLMLIATVKAIAKKPYEFEKTAGTYDPEAIARVYDKIASRSPRHAAALERFDRGIGPAPSFDDIAHAAENVLLDLEREARAHRKGGGQKLVLRHELTRDLARIFEGYGGRVTRSTRFDLDLSSSDVEDGPFHDFLKVVLPVARYFARRAGFRMKSIRSLVSELQASRKEAQKSHPAPASP